MLNSINLKQITVNTLLGVVLAGGLIIQSSYNEANAGRNNNNGHGNNCPIKFTLSSGQEYTIEKYDPSNPGQGDKLGKKLSDLGLNDFEILEAKNLINNGNYDFEKTSDCDGDDSDSTEAEETEVTTPEPVVDSDSQAESNTNKVDVELVLSVDVSTSVNKDEFDLQRDGYVDAFNSTQVQNAIKALPNGLAVTMQFWATEQVVDIGWFKLVADGNGNISNLDEFISKLESVKRTGNYTISGLNQKKKIKFDGQTYNMGGGTDIYKAINAAKDIILSNEYEGDSLVIDVSGDGVADDTPYTGPGNDRGECGHVIMCPPVQNARNAAVAEGIVINGLPIVNNQNTNNLTHKVDEHYKKNVIGGEDAFLIKADFDSFSDAVIKKIEREISADILRDRDTDSDGINDLIEMTAPDGSLDRELDSDGDNIPDYQDTDSDGDDIPDSVEGLADPDQDGVYSYLDLDSDGDGIEDDKEENDTDGDGIIDGIEGSGDFDNDGTPDYKDSDSDDDGIPDSVEGSSDFDNDGKPNYKDSDSDDDGIPDLVEGGSDSSSSFDNDDDPNYLDTDSDGDGISDTEEAGSNPTDPVDSDGDGTPDYVDEDSDGDTISDKDEEAGDYNGDGEADIEPEKLPEGGTESDADGDNTPNYLDTDSDDDGIDDQTETENGTNPYVKDMYAD